MLTTREQIIPIGAGDQTFSLIDNHNLWDRISHIYDWSKTLDETKQGFKIYRKALDCWYFCGVGDPRQKRYLIKDVGEAFSEDVGRDAVINWLTLINRKKLFNHVSATADIGKDVCLDACIGIYHRAVIGNHVLMCHGATVEHNSVIGNYCLLGANATVCGNVIVGEGVLLGAGCVLIPKVMVGCGSIIGAGAVVVEDIPENIVVVGNPAKKLKELPPW